MSYPPGGSVDAGARVIAEFMQKYLKQPVVVVNKPGAGSALAGNELFRSKPDGYTIGMFTSGATATDSAMNPERFLYKHNELQGVAQWSGNCTMVMTRYDAPWKSMKEFVNYAKQNPNKLKWSHQGRGNRDWMVGTLIFQKAGIKLLDVPTAGSNEAMAALLGGNIDASLTSFGPMIIAQMEAKKIQVLGFDTKLESQPNIPSFKELGYDLHMPDNYIGTFAPRGVPAEVIAKLHDAILNATKDPEVRAQFAKMGMPVWYNNGKDLDQLVDDFVKFQSKTLKELGVL